MLTDLLVDPFGARWAEVHDGAQAAEEAGFAGIWTWDHLAGGVHRADRVLESWTLLSALAAVTTRVSVGPLVLNVANRPPGVLAAMAATLQEVGGGRLVLGIGAGGGVGTPYAAEQVALGRPVLPDPVRRRQVADAVAVMRAVWSGRAGALRGFLRPEPPPPIIIGGFGPKMAELAGRVGDGFNTQAGHPRLAALLDIARGARAAAGGDPQAFLATVFAGLERRWLDPASPDRERLVKLGVHRLVLLLPSPPDPRVVEVAGRVLAGG